MNIEKNIFRDPELRSIFPEYLKNIKTYISISPLFLEELFNYWESNDITYKEFEKYYKNNLPKFA